MLGPPSVKRKSIRSGKRKRLIQVIFVNRTVLVVALRLATIVVKLVRSLAGWE